MSSRVLVLIALLVVLPADVASAQSFTQLAGEQGCLVSVRSTFEPEAAEGCGTTTGLLSASRVVVGPDGGHVYVVGAGSDGVTVFARDAGTGALTRASCVTDNSGDGRPGSGGLCADGDALAGASAVAITPDGRSAYATAAEAGAVSWFARDPVTGALTQRGCLKARPDLGERCLQARGLRGAADVVVSPDGARVYVAAAANRAVAVFDVDATTGALTQRSCASDTGSDGACDQVSGLEGANRLTLSPDGQHLYVTASATGALVTLAVDATTGALTARGCLLTDAPAGGPCTDAPVLDGASQAVVTPDGRNVLVVAPEANTLVSYARDATTGALTQQQCLRHAEASGDDVIDDEFGDEEDEDGPAGCEPARALSGAAAIAVSADGRGVFAASDEDYLAAFSRSDSGVLSEFGCAEVERSYKACAQARGTESAIAVAASPDARNLYVIAGSDTLAIFAATVAITRARVVGRATARVVLSCPPARREGCRGRVSAVGARGSRFFAVRPGRSTAVRLRVKRRHAVTLRVREPGMTTRLVRLSR